MTTLADTSAWVEMLRRTGSSLDDAMQRGLRGGDIATTDVVIMEVLAGATDAARVAGIERALKACAYLPQRRLLDSLAAADLYRSCRRAGDTPRRMTDCLIAAVAIRRDTPVLQRDRDFDVLARHSSLKVVAL